MRGINSRIRSDDFICRAMIGQVASRTRMVKTIIASP